jgi:DNA helicase HerA-like ATPase
MLVVCEEAHRYVPADRARGFGPTRRALSRIAKEGRKYSVCLALISPRPSELDASILSQCSTVFAMRMANDIDQDIVKAAVPDAASSLVKSLSALSVREALAFGEGVALPTRIRFGDLPRQYLPRNQSGAFGQMDGLSTKDRSFVATIVDRWRGFSTTDKSPRSGSDAAQPTDALVSEPMLTD